VLLSIDDVRLASKTLDGVVHRTPVLPYGDSVFLKAENLQRSGSFKFRGAFNKVSSLSDDERARGVCTISSGNHAQALALVARELGVRVAILMPQDAPVFKVEATRALGADVVTYDRYSIPQAEAGRRFQAERGMTFVSAHDDPMISAGAATAALELFEDAGPLDVIVAPIGGGGGIAGYATVAKAMSAGTRVLGVEPAAGGITKKSLAAGERLSMDVPKTIADGQQLTTPGAYPFEVMRERVDEVVLVSDEEIVAAMVFLFEQLKVVAEPSGAIATAAVLREKPQGRVGVIISGGNIGIDRFRDLTGRHP
jgi:threonine dehydratase